MKLALALMIAGLLPAQEVSPRETRIFQVKYAKPATLAKVIDPFGAMVSIIPDLNAITVNAPAALMRQIEEAIKRFDVPPPAARNVEVTVYVLSAVEEAGAGVPAELDGVAKQLRAAFGYKSIRLVDTQVIRTREGGGSELSTAVGTNSQGHKTFASYRFGRATISTDEKGRTIRLDGLRLGMKVPIPMGSNVQYTDTGISTDIDVREGQKAVVGKTVAEGAEKSSFFVVMAKVVE